MDLKVNFFFIEGQIPAQKFKSKDFYNNRPRFIRYEFYPFLAHLT